MEYWYFRYFAEHPMTFGDFLGALAGMAAACVALYYLFFWEPSERKKK